MIAYLDYGTRTAGIGGTLTMTGRVRDDMDRIRAVFTDVRGRRQENETPIRLREED